MSGCGTDGGSGSTGGSDGAGGTGGAADTDGMNRCTLYPEQAEGPFYLDLNSLRRDITEGKDGAALRMQVRVEATDCSPLRDLAVDVWHCDADGVYSGFPGQLGGLDTSGQAFLRGTQVTDAGGLAEFETIYPGWYPGRTTHVHFKVHTSSSMEATSQIYFPEVVTSEVYAVSPYAARGQKDTPNLSDGIATASPAPLAQVTGDASSGYVATILVTVA
ncbi:MAG: intradiol ring-cleavage dioxygenase [Myxococcales bacterium]|nr:intradiol ring-cleavage dioxygenase [Myxococcales bacterium]